MHYIQAAILEALRNTTGPVSIFDLATRINMCWDKTERAVFALEKKGLVSFAGQENVLLCR